LVTGKNSQTVKTKRQLYDDWNRCVLRCFLKVLKEVAERTASCTFLEIRDRSIHDLQRH